MNNALIYDFETLSTNPVDGVVTSLALLNFSEERYTTQPYTYEELLDTSKYIKFDVFEQTEKYDRKIMKSTLDWWNDQDEDAKKQIKPSSLDVSISTLHDFLIQNVNFKQLKKSYCRGLTFDPPFMESVLKATGKTMPISFIIERDTRSMIEGMSFGMDLKNSFMPGSLKDKAVKHDPRHDIALDVMRMQMLAQAILGYEEK